MNCGWSNCYKFSTTLHTLPYYFIYRTHFFSFSSGFFSSTGFFTILFFFTFGSGLNWNIYIRWLDVQITTTHVSVDLHWIRNFSKPRHASGTMFGTCCLVILQKFPKIPMKMVSCASLSTSKYIYHQWMWPNITLLVELKKKFNFLENRQMMLLFLTNHSQ